MTQLEFYKNHNNYEIFETPKELNLTIFVDTESIYAVCFKGRSSKVNWRYSFKNIEHMLKYINSKTTDAYNNFIYKKQLNEFAKEKKEQALNELKVGDIFKTSWGYEQTNVNFFQVIEIKKKKFLVKEIGLTVIKQTSWTSDIVTPNKDDFLEYEKWCSLNKFGNAAKIDKYGNSGYICLENSENHRSWGY